MLDLGFFCEEQRDLFRSFFPSRIMGFCGFKAIAIDKFESLKSKQSPLASLSISFLVPLEEWQSGGIQPGCETCPNEVPTADILFFFPSRAGRAWAPFLSGPLGMVGERETIAPVMATPTVSTPSP